MHIKYLGPSDRVNVEPFGMHMKGKIKDYPKDFGEELLATSVKQQFEAVGKSDEGQQTADSDDLEMKTVAELTAMLEEKGVEVPAKIRKADLIKMLEE